MIENKEKSGIDKGIDKEAKALQLKVCKIEEKIELILNELGYVIEE